MCLPDDRNGHRFLCVARHKISRCGAHTEKDMKMAVLSSISWDDDTECDAAAIVAIAGGYLPAVGFYNELDDMQAESKVCFPCILLTQ